MRRLQAGTGLFAAFGLCFAAFSGAAEGERLLVLAVDGGGHELVRGFLREGRLPHFARLRDEGAFADGMATAFPSKTAAAFAMIWTGRPGRETGITGNSVLAVPPSGHSLLETRDGFSAAQLRADPLWTRVSRAGLRAVALHTTHTFPLEEALGRLSPEARDRLFLLTGYAEVRLPPETLTEAAVSLGGTPLPGGVVLPGAGGWFRFSVGDSGFLGVFLDDPADPKAGWDTFAVLADPEGRGAPPAEAGEEAGPPAAGAPLLLARTGIGAEGRFSGAVPAEVEGRAVDFRVRAFAAEAASGTSPARFTVFRSGVGEVAIHPEAAWTERLGRPSWPRAAGAAEYRSGRLGPPRSRKGDGIAEARLIETAAGIADSALEHLEAAASIPDWNLIALYLPIADEMGHLLYGFLDEGLPSHDPALAETLRPTLAGTFAEVDRVLGEMLDLAERTGAHLLVVSDHGMSGTDRLVHLNVALERQGLLAFGPDRLPDLARTQAMLLTTADGSVALNRTRRPQGIVAPGEEERVLAAVRRALLGIRTGEGEPVVTGFLSPATGGMIPVGGASTGDLFPLLRPGFLPSARPAPEVVMPARPAGNHGFLPVRRDMQAVFAGWGPRIRKGSSWPRAQAVDVVPTALDLLGLAPDPDLPGRSLLGSAPLVSPTRRGN